MALTPVELLESLPASAASAARARALVREVLAQVAPPISPTPPSWRSAR